LGAGGGQKDARLLQELLVPGRVLRYTPIDVSAPMVLVAANASLNIAQKTTPIVADLLTATDLSRFIDSQPATTSNRIFTFFGMIPNFEPGQVMPLLAELLRPGDILLFSANLAPGPDYRRGIDHIRPLYENDLTRDWLMTFLLDLGIETSDGELRWLIEGDRYLRLTAYYEFRRDRNISLGAEHFRFVPGDRLRLFFSYRYTPLLISELLAQHGFSIQQQWVTKSEEEAVFLASKL
jgi:SAM-dependent methyltransferase